MKKIFALLFIVFLSITTGSYAQVGITAVPFLQIQPDARASGMGNTGVALANNAAAVYWNPAGLGFQNKNQVDITHAQWLPNFNANLFYDYLAGTHYVKNIGTFGANITYLNLGHQIHTNSQNIQLGRFNSYELAFSISYGRKLSENWSVGTGVRFIHSSLFNGNLGDGNRSVSPASTIAVDLAALYKTDPFHSFGNNDAIFQAGVNLSNIGPGIHYTKEAQKDPLPTQLRIGWAFKTGLGKYGNSSITLTNDYSKIMARRGDGSFKALFDSWGAYTRQSSQGKITLSAFQQFRVGTGLEYWYKHLFSVRTGYYFEDPNNGDRNFITIGAVIRYHSIGVDLSHIFSFQQYGPLANTTRFGLLLNF